EGDEAFDAVDAALRERPGMGFAFASKWALRYHNLVVRDWHQRAVGVVVAAEADGEGRAAHGQFVELQGDRPDEVSRCASPRPRQRRCRLAEAVEQVGLSLAQFIH